MGGPPPTRVDQIVDELHGVAVADPYRWLENGDDGDVRRWVDDQNRHTRAVLDALGDDTELRNRLTALLGAGSVAAAGVAGDLVFSLDRWGHHEQAVLVTRDLNTRGEAQVILDPHVASGDETAAIDWYAPSRDGSLVAYGISTGGSEHSVLRVLDVESGTVLADTIPDTRAASIAWAPDGSGFAYTRYPSAADVGAEEAHYHRGVWWHALGDDPTDDRSLFVEESDKTAWPNVSSSKDGRWLVITVSLGWARTDVHLLDLDNDSRRTVVAGVEAVTGLRVVDGRLLGVTTLDAPRGRVIEADLDDPSPQRWRTLVAESENVIDSVEPFGDELLVATTRSAISSLDRHDPRGRHLATVALPGPGTITALSSHDTDAVGVVGFTSFVHPGSLLRLDDGGLEPWSDLPSVVDPADFVVEQVRYPSVDGTAVPMFLVRAATTVVSPRTPTVLNGYGGFSISNTPAYNPAAVSWCLDGGVWAIANIRGGDEEGEAWHLAGTLADKQNVFDDFHSAADWLVDEGRTSRQRLAIRGGSNGGLLVGAALTQRPDLCRAVHCAVPLLDMVRFHLFLIARLWIPEYGDPDEPEDFAWLYAYSPYHRVIDGTCYPATLLTTALEDSRVDPCHARKMAARLQAATSCGDEHPILLRVEERAGHGQGKPVTKQVDELVDVLSFLADQLAASHDTP